MWTETWKRSKWGCWQLLAVENTACPQKVCRLFFKQIRPPVTSVALCSWSVTYPSSEHWDKMSLIHSRLGIIKDGGLNQPPPWDSLCSQQWVMTVPRALKLTLIIALKTITKQQELADISGGYMVTVDEVMFTWGQKINLKRHLCVHHSAMLKMYIWVCNNRTTGNINR